MLSTMMVPPAYARPGRWHCVDGKWTGFPISVLPILARSCPAVLNENHYTGSCPTDGGACQASCDGGYTDAQGDGVFSCVNGRWLGHLHCVPTDCGPTVDQQPVDASGFARCTDGTTLGSECAARCQDGFFAEAGTGLATFTCADEFGGTWLEQGSPWYQSSLVCARCPAIENCNVPSCTTGTDAVCAICVFGYYSFRHNGPGRLGAVKRP
jgi:hypothetical protein